MPLRSFWMPFFCSVLMAAVIGVYRVDAAAIDLPADQTSVDQGLTRTQIDVFLKAPSPEDQRRAFNRFSAPQKAVAFNYLDLEDQVRAFVWLSSKEKLDIFADLDEKTQSALFAELDETDQKLIFNSLEDREKARILSQLESAQRQHWLIRYPGLNLLIQPETARPPEKPMRPLQPQQVQPAEKAEKPEPSRIEKIMSGDFPRTIDRQLTQFGYNFFTAEPTLAPPLADVPVGDDYVLGPGDSFIVHLWGNVEDRYTVTVNRDGAVFIPRIGRLAVAELTFAQTKKLLENKFKEYYQSFSMSITMDRLRLIQVFIIGEVQQPGAYNISGLSSVIDALYAAGGPRKTGSLRMVKVTRNDGTAAVVDLYSFLVDGRKSEDVRLHSGDTIYVPIVGALVGIAGNVRRPAIYEIKQETTMDQLFDLAGGVMPTGRLQNVVIERIVENRRRIVKSFNVGPDETTGAEEKVTVLQDGDVVKIFPVFQQLRQVVFLEGHVKYPQEYEYQPGMRVRDIIPSYEALLQEPFLPRAEIIRLAPPDRHIEILEFNLGALLEGDESQNLALQDMDRVMVYELAQKTKLPQVTITGAVRQPGTYRLHQGMRVGDLIFRAGNLLPSAFLEHASLSRVAAGDDRTDMVTIDFSPAAALDADSPDNIALKPNDSIFIREIPRYTETLARIITLEGEFKFPGVYTFAEGERLSSVIARAGGLTREAYPFGAAYMREDVKRHQQQRIEEYVSRLEEDVLTLSSYSAETSLEPEEAAIALNTLATKQQLLNKIRNSQPTGRMVVDLEKALENPGSDQDLKLQAGDLLVVNKRADYVNVLGEVYNPMALLVSAEQTVGYYLNLVGGANDSADKKQVYLVRANGTVISKNQEGFLGLASWDTDNQRWTLGGFESIKVNAGDSIIVPKRVEKYPWLRLVKSITEIGYQIAIMTGVLIAVF